ncbi:MAG: IS630 family transposase [Verrucomicrobia bacterium]|nr:IS630 family transposase [Verrucomicrobiota bacterium]
MKKGRPKLKLAMEPHLLDEVRVLHRETQDVRTKERALSILLASGGEHTYEEIAQTLRRSRSTIQLWIKGFEKEGIASFSARQGQGGGRKSPVQNPEVIQAIEQHLENGTWRTAAQARQWLDSERGIKLTMPAMYYWLGKLAGALKVPRPVHIKKIPADAENFKAHLHKTLCGLDIPAGCKVKIWVQDEARYGLHSIQRRCWGLKGVRVVKPAQQKYQWGYVYGALEVVDGGGVFCYLPTVTLENTHLFLEQLAQSDPDAEHIVIWDGAGFHQRPGDPSLPKRIHLIPLPPYSPELNPIERLWDVVKDQICNQVFETLDAIEEKITEALRPYWEQPAYARSLVGEGWLYDQANNTPAGFIPISL